MTTLVLGPDYQPQRLMPLSTCHWQDALRLFFLDKVTVLAWYDDWVIHSTSVSVRVPAVIVTKTGYHKKQDKVALTRGNLFLRDLFQCQYCGETFDERHLTIDHVTPRAKGGKHVWNNVVTACKPCNHKKGDKADVPMNLPRRPEVARIEQAIRRTVTSVAHESWIPYLGLKDPDKVKVVGRQNVK